MLHMQVQYMKAKDYCDKTMLLKTTEKSAAKLTNCTYMGLKNKKINVMTINTESTNAFLCLFISAIVLLLLLVLQLLLRVVIPVL